MKAARMARSLPTCDDDPSAEIHTIPIHTSSIQTGRQVVLHPLVNDPGLPQVLSPRAGPEHLRHILVVPDPRQVIVFDIRSSVDGTDGRRAT